MDEEELSILEERSDRFMDNVQKLNHSRLSQLIRDTDSIRPFLSDADITFGPSTKNTSQLYTSSFRNNNTSGIDFQNHISEENEFDNLFYSFLETSQVFNSSQQIFDLISGFVQNCSDSIELYKTEAGSYKRDVSWLENEKNTWRLIYALYRNRLDEINENQMCTFTCDNDVVQNFYQIDNTVRECQLVIDWLEENESYRFDHKHKARVSHYTDTTVAWENTLFQLQTEKAIYSCPRPLINELDPDAPLRLKKYLHDLDIEDESRLLEEIFSLVRCGRLQKAVEVCHHCGHMWRAAILQGWIPYNDPNYKTDRDTKLPVIGNPNRDIWKLCAWKLTQSESSPTWKAILAAYCGNIAALLPTCKQWEDFLWAYMKVLVDVRVETEIRNASFRSFSELPEQYWDFKFNVEEIFDELSGFSDNRIQIESSKPERLIQKLLILNKLSELISTMSEWCEKNDSGNDHLVRFSAHIIICLRLIGYNYNKPQADRILKAYVKILIKLRNPNLVAFYAATLPEAEQVEMYVEFLEVVDVEKDIKTCLEAAESFGLPVDTITKSLVTKIRSRIDNQKLPGTVDIATPTEEDVKKIESLDWIMYYPHQRGEAIWQANSMMRYFLLGSKLNLARIVFDKVPEDSVKIIMDTCGAKEKSFEDQTSSIPQKFQSAMKEHLCYRSYLDAEGSFNEWFIRFHKQKPDAPVKPAPDAQFSEKVAYEHLMAQYTIELERWKSAVSSVTKTVKSCLYNVLLFPDGGFLVDDKYTDDATRLKELQRLRKICITQIVLLLHTVLHAMECYDESIKLADLIASDQFQLYKVYSKRDLSELLNKICSSSISSLDAGKDPWGHTVSS